MTSQDDERSHKSMYSLINNYKQNEALRHSFNELAKKTYGLDFEDWYQNGYWGDNYNPYSIVKDGEIIANVSVNITDMMWNGMRRKMIQLGTVMTDAQYRNKGFISKIMEAIEAEYAGKVEGMYLFANDSVLEFYPKFEYRKAKEHQYSKLVSIIVPATIMQIEMNDKAAWGRLEYAINKSKFFSQFEMIDNSGLFMFYVTKFMRENVYYDQILDTYVIAEIEGEELLIHAIFSEHEIETNDVIKAFGISIKKVTLGFTPKKKSDYICTELQGDNTTLFVKGNAFADFEREKFMFPTLAHA